MVDTNPQVVEAWKKVFKDHPEVQCIHGNILDQKVDAWVTPTNSKGHMSGGVDYAIKNRLGEGIEEDIQTIIGALYGGTLPVGKAVIVPAGTHSHEFPRYVVATPSMVGESDNLVRTKNTALACAAAFQALYYAEEKKGAAIDSIAVPGLGAGTGKTPPTVCAELMLIGYKLFQRKRYEDFDEMLQHLNEELYGIGQGAAAEVGPQPNTGKVAQTLAGGIEKAQVPGWYPPVDKEGVFIEEGNVFVPSIEQAKASKEAKKAAADAPLEKAIEPEEEEKAEESEVSHVEQPKPHPDGDYLQNMPIGTPIM